jgi:hypothetical protein
MRKSPLSNHLFYRVRASCVSEYLLYSKAKIDDLKVFDALRRRKSTFLADPEWRDNPSKHEPYDLYGELWDLIVDLPSILEQADILSNEAKGSGKFATGLSLYACCRSLYCNLQDWHSELQSQIPGPLYWAIPSSVQNPVDSAGLGMVFPFSLQFQSLHVAQLVLIYWSALALLYNTMHQVYFVLESEYADQWYSDNHMMSQQEESMNRPAVETCFSKASEKVNSTTKWRTTKPPSVEEMIKLSRCICQSVEYCYQTNKGTLGPQSTVFCLWAAKQCFLSQSGYERELSWCSEIKNMNGPDHRFDLKIMEVKGIH